MKVGVIGAGTMGAGIAQTFASAEGYSVVLCDIKLEYAEKGRGRIEKGLEKLVAKGKLEQAAAAAIMAKITTGLSDAVADCDLVVEAALEEIKVKKELFAQLNLICKPETILATNTSSLSITEIAAGGGTSGGGHALF